MDALNKETTVISNLEGLIHEFNDITDLSFANCVRENLERRFKINIHTNSGNSAKIINDSNEFIRELMPGKKIFVFIDDVDQLFTSDKHFALKNRSTLDAFVRFLGILARRSGGGDPLAFRIFIPDALKPSIRSKMQIGMPEHLSKVEQYSIQWSLPRCWDVVNQRLAEASDSRNRKNPILLDRLLTVDALDRMRVYWEKNSIRITPGCVLKSLAELTKYAFEHGVGTEPIKLEICDNFFEGVENNQLCAPDFSYDFGTE